MNKPSQKSEEKDSEALKQNQDLPNIPASSEKIKSEHEAKKEIKESSKLHKDGKTDNTEANSKSEN
jgi:hypothetical protein